MVKCSECGYLTRYAQPSLPEVAHWIERRDPDYPSACFRQVADFNSESVDIERKCDKFIIYTPGFPPKEHFEMQETQTAREEIREQNRKQLRVTYIVGIGTAVAVVVMGILNLVLN